MIAGALGIVSQLLLSWKQYKYGPVQVVVQNPRFDLHHIDFPAVTICSFQKVNAVRANMIFDRFVQFSFYIKN